MSVTVAVTRPVHSQAMLNHARRFSNPRTWFLRNVLLPLGDMVLHQGLMKRLRFLEDAQWWDAAAIRAYRERQLTSLMRVCYEEVPYYRERMDRAGLSWESIRTPEDLRKLPVSGKDDFRAAYPDRVVRPTGLSTYEACTSGSTGANFRVREDAATAGFYRSTFLLCLEWAGWTMGEPHLQNGMNLGRSIDRRIKDAVLRCHYISAYDISDPVLDHSLRTMEDRRIRHLWGYPGSLYHLAKQARQRKWNQPLTSVVTWGDMLYPHYRGLIEEAFGCRVTDTYGCGEGFQLAAQCGGGPHYHTHDFDVIIEYVDSAGNPVPAGQAGDVIVTRLYPGPMPLVRYRVGDRATPSALAACPCGRQLGLLEGIQGRAADVIVTPAGNRLIVHFFTGILEYFTEVDSFQVVQTSLDRIVVRVVPAPGHPYEPALGECIARRLTDHGAHGLRIDVEPVAAIPVSPTGKRRFVISEIAGK